MAAEALALLALLSFASFFQTGAAAIRAPLESPVFQYDEGEHLHQREAYRQIDFTG